MLNLASVDITKQAIIDRLLDGVKQVSFKIFVRSLKFELGTCNFVSSFIVLILLE